LLKKFKKGLFIEKSCRFEKRTFKLPLNSYLSTFFSRTSFRPFLGAQKRLKNVQYMGPRKKKLTLKSKKLTFKSKKLTLKSVKSTEEHL